MLFISELPVWLLLSQANCTGLITTFIFMFAFCAVALKYGLYKKQILETKLVIIAALIAVPMGISFFNGWIPSSKVAKIAAIVHLSTTTFLAAVTIVLSVASICGIINILAILKESDLECCRRIEKYTHISDRTFHRVYGVILIICTILYCALLGGRYVWVDEAYTFAMIRHSFSEIWNITAADVHPPLYYFILKILAQPFGYSLIAAKIVSILPYIFILSFGGYQFRRILGKKTALAFMVLFFLFPFSMAYAVEVRMYSWAAAFVFGNAVYAYRCYYEGKKSNWIMFAVFGVCAAYTHYFALVSTGIVYGLLFILICLNKRKKILPWILASLLTLVFYLPWLQCFIEQLVYKVNNDYWIPELTLHTIIKYFSSIFYFSVFFELAYLLLLVEVLIHKTDSRSALCACVVSVPILTIIVGVVASLAVRPVFVIRYVVPAIPLLVAFLAIAIKNDNIHRYVKLYIVCISIVVGIFGYVSLIRSEYRVTENALDKSFIAKYPQAECYMVFHKSQHVHGVLSYYDSIKRYYSDLCKAREKRSLMQIEADHRTPYKVKQIYSYFGVYTSL